MTVWRVWWETQRRVAEDEVRLWLLPVSVEPARLSLVSVFVEHVVPVSGMSGFPSFRSCAFLFTVAFFISALPYRKGCNSTEKAEMEEQK